MPHVLVGGPVHEAGLKLLHEAGLAVDVVTGFTEPESLELLAKTDAILLRTQKMSAALLNQARRLRVLSRHGVGYDNVDIAALNQLGILLCIVGDANSVSVAEHTMMLMLALARRVLAYDQRTRAGDWRYRDELYSTDLHGKTLLLMGGGRIGRVVATRALAFEMRVEIYDPSAALSQIQALGAKLVGSLPQALARADVLSLHIPAQAGQAVIGKEELQALKPGAIVINTARGGIIDELALAEALASGHVAGVGLDVFENEPPDLKHPLFRGDNVILTPHAAGLSQEAAMRTSLMAAQNIIDFFEGCLDPAVIINRASILQGPSYLDRV